MMIRKSVWGNCGSKPEKRKKQRGVLVGEKERDGEADRDRNRELGEGGSPAEGGGGGGECGE